MFSGSPSDAGTRGRMAMNSELQAQSDAITGALKHLETAVHQDVILATAIVSAMLLVLVIVIFIRR